MILLDTNVVLDPLRPAPHKGREQNRRNPRNPGLSAHSHRTKWRSTSRQGRRPCTCVRWLLLRPVLAGCRRTGRTRYRFCLRCSNARARRSIRSLCGNWWKCSGYPAVWCACRRPGFISVFIMSSWIPPSSEL